MSHDKSERDRPLNIDELRDSLLTLGVNIPERTLWRWAQKGLIPSPEKRGLGRGKGTTVSVWRDNAVWQAAGIWALRAGFGNNWSRSEMNAETIKTVQQLAAKVYGHPKVLLSIPDNTSDDDDPPVEDVAFSVSADCPPKLEPFIIPYVTAILKAFWSWRLKEPALITFVWRNSATKSESGTIERPICKVSLGEAPHAKDELRFIVDGRDVREWLLQDRALMRALRQRNPPFFQRLRSLMRKLREDDPRFIELNSGQSPIIELLRSLIRKFSKDDPQFYGKLRSLMYKLRESENDPQFYEQLTLFISTIREQDPKLYEKLALLTRAIGGRSFDFIEKLRLPIRTAMKLSLAKEPLDTTFIHNMYEKAHREKIDEDEDYYYKEIYKKYKGNVKEQPNVPQRELDLLLAVASSYDELKKNESEADSTDRQKRTGRQKKPSKR
jgi:hypothetical protein